jgi:Asp-tRNA(Asn)/Glu-tRNA(Gln) amidotransferase C subunit
MIRQCRPIHLQRYYSAIVSKSLIPKPTWSIDDLKLTDPIDPVTPEELQTLAKRALLDISDNKKIRQDLATMIHFLRQLERVKGRTMTACDIYDIPRGVTKAPLRTGVATPNETKEAKQVYKSLLQPKTIQQGGHEYFSVVTKIEEKG